MREKGIRNGLTALVLVLAMLLCTWAAAEEIPEDAQDLVPDQEMTASVGENMPAYFRFVPEETAVYDFRSLCGDDTYGYLYQEEEGTLQLLTSNDDEDENTSDFCISQILTEGETYYFAARFWDPGESGNFSVVLTRNDESGLRANAVGLSQVSVKPDESVTLRVIALGGEGELTYYWMRDGMEMTGQTTDVCTVERVTDVTEVNCYVSDQNEEVTVPFYIKIDNGFSAEADGPKKLSVKPDTTVTLTVKAQCEKGGLIYQWYKPGYNEETGDDSVPIEGATGPSYTEQIEGNMLPYGSLEYSCEVQDEYGNHKTICFELKIENSFIAYEEGPREITVKPGETVTMKVFAQVYRGNVYYRWYEILTDAGYKTVEIEDAHGASYTTDEIRRCSQYMCFVTDDYGSYKEIWFDIYLDNGFSVTAESPTEMTVNPGETVTMKVSAKANEGEITYQWYKKDYIDGTVSYYNKPITGATSASLTVENVQSYGEYHCVAIDAFRNPETVYFTVSIDNDFYTKADGPLILTVDPGEPLTLKVIAKAKAGEITYQWYQQNIADQDDYDLKKIEGATEAVYTAAKVDRHGLYFCDVRDSYGTMTRVMYWVYVDNGLIAEADGPDHVTAGAGDMVTLKVRASAKEGDITYKWLEQKYEEKGDNYYYTTSYMPGENGESLIIEATGFRREIVCRVTDHYDNSTEVVFVIDAENMLTAAPEGSSVITVTPGKTATLKVRAETGAGEILYNWYKVNYIKGAYKQTKVSGTENRNTYTTEALYQNSQYMCLVRDRFGNEESIYFMVNVGSVQALQVYVPALAEINAGETYAMFSFEPPVSGNYRIESTGSEDTIVTLIDGSGHGKWDSMVKDDDGGEDLNFGLEYELEAGHLYYYGIGFYSGKKTGTISFLLTGSFPTIEESFVLPKGMTAEIPVPEEFGQPVSASVSDGTVATVSGKTVTAMAVGDTAATVFFENGAAVYHFTVLSADGILKLPEGLETLMEDAFSGDESIRIAELGSAVKTAARNALAAPNLAVAVIRGKTTQLDPDTFGDVKPLIVCPAGSEAEIWARQHECKLLYIP